MVFTRGGAFEVEGWEDERGGRHLDIIVRLRLLPELTPLVVVDLAHLGLGKFIVTAVRER